MVARDEHHDGLVRTLDAEGLEDVPPGVPIPRLSPGSRVGRYVLLDMVGAGAMGIVYAAYDPELDRKVALKLLHPDLDAKRGRAGQSSLLREARAMAKLTDPAVIAVHDVGAYQGRIFVAMEFVEGTTLTRWLKEHDGSWEEILDLFVVAGTGLLAAHRAGLVHADFKPDNVMVGRVESGRGTPPVRVTDFGLARAHGHALHRVRVRGDDRGELESKLGIGTPAYMSPEQHLGLEPDASSDQFSFCVALFEALHGYRPFSGTSYAELSGRVLAGSIEPLPRDTPVPNYVNRAILRGLSSDPAARFESMEALLEELQRTRRMSRRRWGVTALGLGLVASTLAFVAAAAPDDESVCTGGAERLQRVWNSNREQELRRAFSASRIDGRAMEAAIAGLDAHGAAWLAAHVDACEATHVRHEQSNELLDRRMVCLRRNLEQMDALLDVFADDDPESLRQAISAIHRLPDLERCRDERVLLRQIEPPPPDALEALDELHAMAARARALADAGRFDEGRVLADRVVRRADEIGYRPARAEAHAQLGVLELRAGTYRSASRHLMRSFWDAVAVGDDRSAAITAIHIVEAIRLGRGDLDLALMWAEHARAQLDRASDDPLLEARHLDAVGVVRAEAGDFEGGRRDHEAALTLRQRHLATDHPVIADSLENLGRLARRQNRLDEAITLHEDVLRIRLSVFGPDHPEVAMAHEDLARTHEASNRLADALSEIDRALEIRQRELGFDHPLTARAYAVMGDIHARRNALDAAERAYRRAIELWKSRLGENHPDVTRAMASLAAVLEDQGASDAALDLSRRALTLRLETHGPEHPDVARALGDLADILERRGRLYEAIEQRETALDVLIAAHGDGHRDVGLAYRAAGRVLEALARNDEAMQYYAKALEILQEELGPDDIELAATYAGLGRTQAKLGALEAASSSFERALSLFERHDGEPTEIAETAWATARALEAAGLQPRRARELALRARELHADIGRADIVKSIDRWLRRRPDVPSP